MFEDDKSPMEKFEDLGRKLFQVPKEEITDEEPIEEEPQDDE